MSLDEQLPIANWPTESGEYKVVQLDVDGQPHLRFADRWYETHALIIKSLARKLGRDYPEIEINRECGKDSIPALESEWYKVHGMGRAGVNVEQRQAYFSGHSFDYSIGIDAEHL